MNDIKKAGIIVLVFFVPVVIAVLLFCSGTANACDYGQPPLQIVAQPQYQYQMQVLQVQQPVYYQQQVQRVVVPQYVQQQRIVQRVVQPAYVQQQVVLQQRRPVVLRQRAQVLRSKTVVHPERGGIGRLLFGR